VICGFPAGGQEIWMSATEPVWRKIHGFPPNDYMNLFEPDAPWHDGARVVSVFLLSKKFIVDSDDDDVRRVLSNLQDRHIALAIQGTPLLATKICGLGIEGYGPPTDMVDTVLRVNSLGGSVKFIVMDEPLYYGHEFDGRGEARPCHLTVSEVAAQAATKIAAMHDKFPSVQVGDVEPIGIDAPSDDVWARDLVEWAEAYKQVVGVPLAFMQTDLLWPRPNWQSQFRSAVEILHDVHVPLGVIYNASRRETSDIAWVSAAREHIRVIESMLSGHPDQAIFMTWTDRPRQMLPEIEPGTLTYLVRSYTH